MKIHFPLFIAEAGGLPNIDLAFQSLSGRNKFIFQINIPCAVERVDQTRNPMELVPSAFGEYYGKGIVFSAYSHCLLQERFHRDKEPLWKEEVPMVVGV